MWKIKQCTSSHHGTALSIPGDFFVSSGSVGIGYMLGDDLAFLEISEDSPMQN